MNRDSELVEARERAQAQRRALRETMDHLHHKLDVQAERVEATVESARALAVRTHRVVHDRPWFFVAGSITLGVVLGLVIRRHPKGRRLALTAGDGRVVEIVAPPRRKSSVLGFVGGLIGKALVRGVIAAIEKHYAPDALDPLDRAESDRTHGETRD
ncbi:MAG: hypothetical protein IT384_01475 [Deltaproteobacteria bacterium]|nr:hypothetical protein [Deltaproteobacteria bacterium]